MTATFQISSPEACDAPDEVLTAAGCPWRAAIGVAAGELQAAEDRLALLKTAGDLASYKALGPAWQQFRRLERRLGDALAAAHQHRAGKIGEHASIAGIEISKARRLRDRGVERLAVRIARAAQRAPASLHAIIEDADATPDLRAVARQWAGRPQMEARRDALRLCRALGGHPGFDGANGQVASDELQELPLIRRMPQNVPSIGVGDRLLQVRADRQMTQEEFAAALCCSNVQVSEMERELRPVQLNYLLKVSWAYGVDLEWLAYGPKLAPVYSVERV